jgi:hypothetical protein
MTCCLGGQVRHYNGDKFGSLSPYAESRSNLRRVVFYKGADYMDAVRMALTDEGSVPIHYSFLWNNVIRTWDPEWGFVTVKIRDPKVAAACREYLSSIGAKFHSMDELRSWAVRHNWPKAEQIPDLDK